MMIEKNGMLEIEHSDKLKAECISCTLKQIKF